MKASLYRENEMNTIINVAVSEGSTVGKDEAINAKLCGRDYSTGMIGSLRTDRLTLTQEHSQRDR